MVLELKLLKTYAKAHNRKCFITINARTGYDLFKKKLNKEIASNKLQKNCMLI